MQRTSGGKSHIARCIIPRNNKEFLRSHSDKAATKPESKNDKQPDLSAEQAEINQAELKMRADLLLDLQYGAHLQS